MTKCKYCLSETNSCSDIEAEICDNNIIINSGIDLLLKNIPKRKMNLTNREVKLLKDELECIIACIEGSQAVLPAPNISKLLDPIMRLTVDLHDSITRQTRNTINEIEL